MVSERIILGIDPGTQVTGYGVIRIEEQQIQLLAMGALLLSKHTDHPKRLSELQKSLRRIVETYLPDECAIEAPFFGKNVQSMLKLGRAQGVCMAVAMARDIPVEEYSPRRVKQAITGNGNASKEQVAAMVKQICGYTEEPRYNDATDGLAIALCHYYSTKNIIQGKGSKGWTDYIKKNPGKLR
ncbi:MAG: crossover junction endodeoxyribonuclease RuvC [Saprospirales bacterium]|nr:crossover junction endodeoxyribonuclease RuvC [Saprospirales bacterium]|tara:strand:- start:1938 stop:2489 length:552 start_codon:yes stop_codon:yes gene_type:complete